MTELTLDSVLSDDGFIQIIQTRLNEMDGIDVQDPEFQAIWCAADYRLKLYSTKKDKKEEINKLMDVFRKKNFVPQYNLCGPPTIHTNNISMSPKGDLACSSHLDNLSNGEGVLSVTIIASGNAIPLTTITLGSCKWGAYQTAFSNNSRHIAISTHSKLEIWDIFGLKRIGADETVSNIRLMSWSKDASKLSVCDDSGVFIFDVSTMKKIETGIESEQRCIKLNDDGSTLLSIGKKVSLYRPNEPIKVCEAPITVSQKPVAIWKNDSFYVITNGRCIKIDSYGTELISDLSEWLDTSDLWKDRAQLY